MAVWNPRANAVFADILELPPAQRQAFLEDACGIDGELRQQVEALLAAHAAAGNFLDQPVPSARNEPTTAPDSGPPLPANGNVVQALATSRVQLRDPDGEAPTPVAQVGSDNVPRGLDPAGRLQVLGEIARGGMGAVFKGRDPALGRDLAVKVLLETHRGRTELVQRFVEEAQIAGQLQHPGVVPVYELGQFPDRRPYFTMKLVKGQTLAALLAARKDPAEERSRFVGIFGQVCQTLAYAHARGVIHRDLKPANVMVGSFGEVQVMDWGLAKVLRKGGAADKQMTQAQQTVSVIQTRRSAGSPDVGSHTQAGSAMGTPGYLAPEQARGDTGLVDERADVFGLGAILCEILTGQPPFTGRNAEAMHKAQAAQLDDALRRLEGCGADTELVGLARRCLAAEPWDRPRDSGAVVAAVMAYQNSVAERLRQAELARAAEAARAEEARATAAAERKARRRTRALAVAVLALLAAGAGAGLWVQRQVGERRRQVESALDRAEALRQQAHWAEARAVLEQARQVLGDGPADLRHRLDVAEAELALVNRLDAIRQRRAAWVEGHFDNHTAERDYAAAFEEAGLGKVSDDEEMVANRVRDSGVSGALVAALDDWAFIAAGPRSKSWLLGVARRAAPDPWGDRFRDVAVWQDRQKLRALADEALRDGGAKLDELSPQVLTALGELLGGAESVPLLRTAQRHYPNDFWLNIVLGNALNEAKQHEEAVGYERVAVALRPDAAAAHNNLGLTLLGKGDWDGAMTECRTAITLDDKLAFAHSNLGNALYAKGQPDEAIREYHTAIDLDPKEFRFHDNLGSALCDKGQLDEAIREHHTAIDLDPKAASPHHNLARALAKKGQLDEAIREYRTAIDLAPREALPHNNLGIALRDKGQLDEAIREHRRAIDLDPKAAQPHVDLGAALYAKGQLDEAITAFRRAIDLAPKYALAHSNLGNALREKGQLDEAIRECRAAIDLDPKEAGPHNNLGIALNKKGDLDGAIAEFRQAIRLAPTDAALRYNLGLALYAKGDLDGAIAEYRKAIELDPKYALAHFGLGRALRAKGDLDEAIAAYGQAIALAPDYPEAHCNLGHALRAQGRFAEALDELRRGDALGRQRPGWTYPSADWVRQAERLVELDRRLSAVLGGQGGPANDAERLALAQLCAEPFKKNYTASARFYAEAFAHDAKLADDLQQQHRYNAACAAALAGCGQGEDARALPDKERLRLRRQALDWLKADLTAHAKLVERDDPAAKPMVRQCLKHWRQDADLAGLRDPEAVEKLPPHEREAWRALWAEVEALLRKAGEQPK
jgi:serine/threonine-protein kinase